MKRVSRVMTIIMVFTIFLSACGKAEDVTVNKTDEKINEDSVSQDSRNDSKKIEDNEDNDPEEEKNDSEYKSDILAGLSKLITGNDADVIVTLNGDTKLNLTGDVAEVIRTVEEDNGIVVDNYNHVSHVNNNGKVYFKQGETKTAEIVEIANSKDYRVFLQGAKNQIFLNNKEVPGYLLYSFSESYISGLKDKKVNISTMKDWDGDFLSVEDYMTEINGFEGFNEEDDEKKLGIEILKDYEYQFILFRNGRIVPLTEIIENYWDEAKTIVDEHLSIYEYYMQTRNWEREEALKFFSGSVLGKYMNTVYKNPIPIGGEEYQIYQKIDTILRNVMYLQMGEWEDNKDGSVENYGVKEYSSSHSSLEVYIHRTHEELAKVLWPYYMDENGELIDKYPDNR
ncbi:MAG: hypothetical protein K6G45_10210 [Lachnospiraceae bacterium]|nr:hypothetical protein [Lachnospiraceae bacterium]